MHADQRTKRPEDFTTPLQEGDNTNCAKYRTIALRSHSRKISLSIIHQRIQQYYESEISETGQLHARQRDQILNV